MRALKRSECAILPLVLKGKWYRMIESGEKREEYRDDTEYWSKRISHWIDQSLHVGTECVVEFRLGYAKSAPRMAFSPRGLRGPDNRSRWHPEWGEPDARHWAIELGERVHLTT